MCPAAGGVAHPERVPFYLVQEEALFQFPMLKKEGLKGGIVYYDGIHNDTRMNVLIALTACQHGATIANYVNVVDIVHDATGQAGGAKVCDKMTGKEWTIKAKGVINATGCFADAVRKMDDPNCEPLIVGAAGVHLILPDHFSPDKYVGIPRSTPRSRCDASCESVCSMGLIIPKTRDDRVLFFFPWEGMTICGTTDSPSEITMTPAPTEDDVRFIIEESNLYLNRRVTAKDVKAAWSGVRPLVRDPSLPVTGNATSQISRKHVVEESKTGLVSIMGGKWTTYRRMAQDAIEKVHDAASVGVVSLLPRLQFRSPLFCWLCSWRPPST